MLNMQFSHVRSKGIGEKEWRHGILQLDPCATVQLQKMPVSGTDV